MDADRIRELVARQEGAALDFKREQYDWPADGNLELAKDIMAIANGLPRVSAVGHILIGVEESSDRTGTIVGVSPSAHLDDAIMHEKVKMLVNRVPSFAYAVVEVDGFSVGAFEIRGGGRPFFALRDGGKVHKLRRFEAPLRIGSATDVASPEQIQAWAAEDDPSLRDLRRVEIEEREGRLVVQPFIETVGVSFSEDPNTFEDTLVLDLIVHNRGASWFTIESVRQTWTLTPRFYSTWPERDLRVASTSHSVAIADPGGAGVPPGASQHLRVPVDSGALYAYVKKEFDLVCAATHWPLWIDGEVSVAAVGVTGRRGSFARPVATATIEAAYDAGREVADAAREEQRRLDAAAERDAACAPVPFVGTIPASAADARAAARLLESLAVRRRR